MTDDREAAVSDGVIRRHNADTCHVERWDIDRWVDEGPIPFDGTLYRQRRQGPFKVSGSIDAEMPMRSADGRFKPARWHMGGLVLEWSCLECGANVMAEAQQTHNDWHGAVSQMRDRP